jgi:hypothetical protein
MEAIGAATVGAGFFGAMAIGAAAIRPTVLGAEKSGGSAVDGELTGCSGEIDRACAGMLTETARALGGDRTLIASAGGTATARTSPTPAALAPTISMPGARAWRSGDAGSSFGVSSMASSGSGVDGRRRVPRHSVEAGASS